MRRRIIALAASLCLSLALIGVTGGVAGAHSDEFKQGADYFYHGYSGTWFDICDAEDDGHSVWAGYYMNGSTAYWTANVVYLGDPDGVDCTRWNLPAGHYLTNIRVVEDNPNSSTNYYGPWHGWPVAGT